MNKFLKPNKEKIALAILLYVFIPFPLIFLYLPTGTEVISYFMPLQSPMALAFSGIMLILSFSNWNFLTISDWLLRIMLFILNIIIWPFCLYALSSYIVSIFKKDIITK